MTVRMICIHPGGARFFGCRSLDEGVRFSRSVVGDLQKIVREVEEEVLHYSKDSLIIAAEEALLSTVLGMLSRTVCEQVIGTVTEDLYEANETDLIHYVDDFIEPDGGVADGTTVFSRPEAELPSDDTDETWSETGADDLEETG